MNNIFTALSTAQPATAAIVTRTLANSATCALIGTVHSVITREQKALARGVSDAVNDISAYSDMRDEAQDDDPVTGNMDDVPTKITLPQLVEWTAAIRAYSQTVADGLEGQERRFAQPQEVADSLDFMCKARTSVTQDQVDAVLEEEPELSRADAVKLVQALAIDDATKLQANRTHVLDRVTELLNDAPADREMDSIFADLPENYRTTLLEKACTAVVKELDRTLPLAVRGIPGISAKRKILKGDLPSLEALAA